MNWTDQTTDMNWTVQTTDMTQKSTTHVLKFFTIAVPPVQ